jgi:GNAT superfamily N-acetyltransferase
VKIRNGSSKDIHKIIELLEELGRSKSKSKSEKTKFKRLVSQYLSDSDKQILLAEENSSVVGMASLVFVPRLNQSKLELWIPEMVVSKVHQNKGIGKELVKACVKIAKKRNCFRVRLESGNERKATHEFYKKTGLEQYALSFKKAIDS